MKGTRLAVGLGLAAVLLLGGCASSQRTMSEAQAQDALQHAEAQYGIRIEGLQLSAAGSMLDLRYRVVDPEKARPILDGRQQPYLLDEARSAQLGVPETPVLGRLRQTARNNVIHTDHTYFVMFGNPGKAVHSGDKLTLQIGQLKITDLLVR